MEIDYVEIRDSNRDIIGYIYTAISIIWHSVYYGVGDFEIHAQATGHHLYLLEVDNYVTRQDDNAIGIIEKIEVTKSETDGEVITATGRFAKSILDRRLIYKLSGKTNKATILRGNVETNIRNVVKNNAISCSFDSARNIPILQLGAASGLPAIIVDDEGNASEKQASYENLLKFTDEVLQEYNMGAEIVLDKETKKFLYLVYQGDDRSVDQTNYTPVIISKEFDNLLDSYYADDSTNERNMALIGGEGEGLDRFYSVVKGSKTGLARKEVFVDSSSKNITNKADELQEIYPTGTFTGLNFVVGGTVYATLKVNLDNEYTYNSLHEKFPSGTLTDGKFIVGGVIYARKIYTEDNAYKLTPLGYKAMLAADGNVGDYTYTNSIYQKLLNTDGKQAISEMKRIESFSGTINVNDGQYQFNRDYFLGDVVTIQDNTLGKYANVRILEATEVQDENGYTVEISYE